MDQQTSQTPGMLGRTLLVAAGLAWVAAFFTAVALAGLLVGVVMLGILFGVPLTAAAIGQGRMPWALKQPQRDECYLIGSFAGIAALSVISWLLLPAWAWVAVPIVGLGVAVTLYGFKKLEPSGAESPSDRSDRLRRLRIRRSQSRSQDNGYRGATNTLMKDWSVMLSQVDIFKDLTPEEMQEVAALGNVRMVREGESLGIEGQPGEHVYVILDGSAQLSANSSVGRITARMAGPGESMPLASILSEGTLITSIDARTDMRVWQVDSSKLRLFFAKNPEIGSKVYYAAASVLAERYRRTLWRLTEQSAGVAKSESFWANV